MPRMISMFEKALQRKLEAGEVEILTREQTQEIDRIVRESLLNKQGRDHSIDSFVKRSASSAQNCSGTSRDIEPSAKGFFNNQLIKKLRFLTKCI